MSEVSIHLSEIEGPLKSGQYVLNENGIEIPFRFRSGQTDALLIIFHGGLNRKTREYPFFQPFLPIDVNQISIADPTVAEDPRLGSGWYIGAEGWNLPEKILRLVMSAADSLGLSKRIYIGASAGGFASLLYSFMDKGSIVVTANPQTHLPDYPNSHFERLRQVCWPSCKTIEEFEQEAPISVSSLYSKQVANQIIYIQSSGDYEHVKTQFRDFLSKLHPANFSNLILDVGFWNVLGHSGSVPPSAWIPWVRTVLSSKALDTDGLLMARNALFEKPLGTLSTQPSHSHAPSSADIIRADLVRDELLNS